MGKRKRAAKSKGAGVAAPAPHLLQVIKIDKSGGDPIRIRMKRTPLQRPPLPSSPPATPSVPPCATAAAASKAATTQTSKAKSKPAAAALSSSTPSASPTATASPTQSTSRPMVELAAPTASRATTQRSASSTASEQSGSKSSSPAVSTPPSATTSTCELQADNDEGDGSESEPDKEPDHPDDELIAEGGRKAAVCQSESERAPADMPHDKSITWTPITLTKPDPPPHKTWSPPPSTKGPKQRGPRGFNTRNGKPTPKNIFLTLVPREVWNGLAKASTAYARTDTANSARQNPNKPTQPSPQFTPTDIKNWVCCNFAMGLLRAPNIEMYWNGPLAQPSITSFVETVTKY